MCFLFFDKFTNGTAGIVFETFFELRIHANDLRPFLGCPRNFKINLRRLATIATVH